MITDVNCDGTYLNFKINKISIVKQLIQEVHSKGSLFGSTTEGNGKTVVVEFRYDDVINDDSLMS